MSVAAMRFLAFTLLAFAAFDWPLPWLDRLGAAFLGLAALGITVGAASNRTRRALPFAFPTKTVAVGDEASEAVATLAQRIAAYEP